MQAQLEACGASLCLLLPTISTLDARKPAGSNRSQSCLAEKAPTEYYRATCDVRKANDLADTSEGGRQM